MIDRTGERAKSDGSWARYAAVATFVAPLAVGLCLGLLAGAAGAAPTTIYNSIPSPLPGNLPSWGFEADSVSEFGGQVAFVGTARQDPTITVTMSSWGCESGHWYSGDCSTTPGATVPYPIALNIYSVNPDNSPGPQIATLTQTFAIPYRPSADPLCTGGRWRDGSGTCFNGFAFTIAFTLPSGVLPDSAIVSVAYNTTHYGAAPIGQSAPCYTSSGGCIYDSLNVGLTAPPSVGSDPLPDDAYQSSTWGGAYCDNGTGGTGVFRRDAGCWTGYQPALSVQACDCFIGGVCYGNGDTDPNDQCKQCNSTTPNAFALKSDGASCNDGVACTKNDICTAGQCAGTAYTCASPDQCHLAGTCNGDGTCSFANVPNGKPCSDGNACTTNDRCAFGQCLGAPDVHHTLCDDHNPCTDDSCNPSTGCVHTNNAAPCNDNNACTSGDACSGGQCVGGGATNCDDQNPCTADSCDVTGGCGHSNLPDRTQCNDSTGNAGSCFAGGCCVPVMPGLPGVKNQAALSSIESQCPSCPRKGPKRGKYLTCVNKAAKNFVKLGGITKAEQKLINQAAQHSNVGLSK